MSRALWSPVKLSRVKVRGWAPASGWYPWRYDAQQAGARKVGGAYVVTMLRQGALQLLQRRPCRRMAGEVAP